MADFNLKPDFVFNSTKSFKTLISAFENGSEQRRAKWASGLTKYTLQYSNRPQADFDTVKTLFDAKNGMANSFVWTHPISGVDLTVRFNSDDLSCAVTGPGIVSFEFELLQVK